MLRLCEPVGCAGSFAWPKALTHSDKGVSPDWGSSVRAAQAGLRASEDPRHGFPRRASDTGKDSAMKATIFAAVIGLAALLVSSAQAGHMM